MNCIITKYYSSYQIKEDQMGGTCGNMGDEREAHFVVVGKPEEMAHLCRLGADGRIILELILRK
jgi:hypothetical protein